MVDDDDLDCFADINFEAVASQTVPPTLSIKGYEITHETAHPADVAGDCSKKKKKKKKAKPQQQGNQSEVEAVGVAPDAHERYLNVIDKLRGEGDDGEAWLSLDRCGIGDKKLRKLTDLMVSNAKGTRCARCCHHLRSCT